MGHDAIGGARAVARDHGRREEVGEGAVIGEWEGAVNRRRFGGGSYQDKGLPAQPGEVGREVRGAAGERLDGGAGGEGPGEGSVADTSRSALDKCRIRRLHLARPRPRFCRPYHHRARGANPAMEHALHERAVDVQARLGLLVLLDLHRCLRRAAIGHLGNPAAADRSSMESSRPLGMTWTLRDARWPRQPARPLPRSRGHLHLVPRVRVGLRSRRATGERTPVGRHLSLPGSLASASPPLSVSTHPFVWLPGRESRDRRAATRLFLRSAHQPLRLLYLAKHRFLGEARRSSSSCCATSSTPPARAQ